MVADPGFAARRVERPPAGRPAYAVSSKLILTGETQPSALPDHVPLAGRQFDDVSAA